MLGKIRVLNLLMDDIGNRKIVLDFGLRHLME